MARIRTVKPQFWTDGKIRRLSDTTALFFISLWNFADDYGFIELDTFEISMKVARWRSQDIMRMLWSLQKSGMIRLSTGDHWVKTLSSLGDGHVMEGSSPGHGLVMVESWHHQKIDKPRLSKWKDKQIHWDSIDHSATDQGSFDASIGEERAGKDRIGKGGMKNTIPRKSRKPAASAPEGTQLVIARYCQLWKAKYKANAPVGGKVVGQIKTLVKDHGVYKATQFIDAYLEMPDSWFVTKRHDITTLLANLNAVAQFIETGRMFTRKEINNFDSSNTLRNTLEAIDRGEI